MTETSIILAVDLAFQKPAKFQYCISIIKTLQEENSKFDIRVNFFINRRLVVHITVLKVLSSSLDYILHLT